MDIHIPITTFFQDRLLNVLRDRMSRISFAAKQSWMTLRMSRQLVVGS